MSATESVHIEDITSSKVQIIDSAEKMLKVLQEIGNAGIGSVGSLIEPLFMSWDSFSDQKKKQKYSEYTCHELNFFLFKRDKPFFDEVVKPFISSKMEKTFIDWYLLGSDQPSDNEFVQ